MIAFFKALCLIWKNRQQLARLFELLPPALAAAGESMQQAGQGAISAGNFIKGGGGVPVNARQVVEQAAEAIAAGKQKVDDTADFLEDAGTEIGKVKVPTVSFTTTSIPVGIGSVEVVNGITLTQASLFGLVKDALNDSAEKLRTVSTHLQTTAANLHSAAAALNDAGNGFKSVGNFLISSGSALKQITE